MRTIGTESPPIPAVISFTGPLPEPTIYRPPAERLISGDPLQKAWMLFTSPDGRFSAGIWDCQPGKWRVVFTESEFCQLLSGRIAVTRDGGDTIIYQAGDAFLSPAGFTGAWDVLEPARKYFAFYE